MKTFQEWLKEGVQVYNDSWGVEISGTTAEVIEALKKYPQTGICIASVEFENAESKTKNLGLKHV